MPDLMRVPHRSGDNSTQKAFAPHRNIRADIADDIALDRMPRRVVGQAAMPRTPETNRTAAPGIPFGEHQKDDNVGLNIGVWSCWPTISRKTFFGINQMLRTTFVTPLLALLFTSMLVACGKGTDKAEANAEKDKGQPLLISAEDLHTVRSNALASGPTITGSVQPERRADLRAEVSAVVLQVLKENGDAVRRGDLLARLDDTAIRDSLSSAEASARAAGQAFEQTERQFQRMTTLRASGMASAQALDDAETRRNNAQSDLAAARTRSAQARQQLQRTEARAPFDGIVSDRKVSAGDTAQIGKELLKVIDPASMRFEGLVSADKIGDVKTGQPVSFRVNGYGEQEFIGKVRRVNPAANATTRQVEVLVDFVDQKHPKLAGLYAEGRIEAASSSSLTVPATALVRDGDKASIWRVKDKKLQKTAVVLGERDVRSGDFVLLSGLTADDRVIRYPAATLKDGQRVEMSAPPVAATAPPAPAAAVSTAGSTATAASKSASATDTRK